ncbi:hypothetical protein ACFLY2_00565 [Patescibacteria group bacterium]
MAEKNNEINLSNIEDELITDKKNIDTDKKVSKPLVGLLSGFKNKFKFKTKVTKKSDELVE